ncbi:hypothetical protein [Caballeronia sp. ATUFL_M1_KS5A]|uniref:hypothetical protein n=1 Tax=Caballeronia sp. ATUFL_M1_KS5A TaxID=2921778 RepID=UPI0020292C53|nr:hypothetical protein [Caballeronia sp. ATUFL_M1_KS5A]
MRGELFRDVNVALSTSYRMATLPAVDAGATRRALVTVACLSPTRSRMHADWVKRLIGQPSRVVDFSGLTRLETRAQCALVRQFVLERLSLPQASAIIARYSQTPGEKRKGVSGLVTHLSSAGLASTPPALDDDPPAELLWDLLWRRYLPARHGDGLSLREIARRTSTSKSALARRAVRLDDDLDALERDAIASLERLFVNQGVCYMSLDRFGSEP